LGGKLITVKYSKDREEPIKLSEPKIPAHLAPWFVVELCEAESCFDITIQKSETTKSGFSVNIRFRFSRHMEKDLLTRAHFLKVRRINIAVTLALTAPIATILFLKFGKLSLFYGIHRFFEDKNKIVNNNELLNNLIPIFTTLLKKKNKDKYPNLLKLILFIIICVGIYNIFIYITSYIIIIFIMLYMVFNDYLQYNL
jgi:hypothetical protein